MKLIKARLKGYAGIYRGSKGLTEITIDFTKCMHNIILIEGHNGAGKSTILDALQPMPDNNNVLIRNMEAEKELLYIHEDIIYKVYIIHGLRQDGSRAVTKAFFSEIINGNEVELNPNGNISSYKEILYDKFNLDPNFVSLSHLSVDDKGIVNKSPGERKKFVSGILDTVEIYNDIYRKLSKKSLSYKSLLTSITAKIDSIGNKTMLQSNLESLQITVDQLSNQKELMSADLARYEASIHMIDPNNQIQNKYTSLRRQLSELQSNLNRIELSLIKYKDLGINDLHSIDILYSDKSTLLVKLESEITAIKANLETMIQLRDNDLVSIQNKTAKLNNLTSDYNYKDLEKNIRELKISINQCLTIFHKIGLDENNIMTKDEFILAVNTIRDVKDMLDNIKGNSYNEDIEKALYVIINNYDTISEIEGYKKEINNLSKRLIEIDKLISYNEGLIKTLEILENRPNDCKIDNCPFIKEALNTQSLDPINKLGQLLKEKIELEDKIKQINYLLDSSNNVQRIIASINIILNNINLNNNILAKLPRCEIFTNTKEFLIHFMSNDCYNILQEIYDYGKYSNFFEVYKANKELLSKYEKEYSIYHQKADIIEEINNDLDELNKKVNIIIEKIHNENKILKEKSLLIEEIKNELEVYRILHQLYSEKEHLNESIMQINNELDNLSSSMNDINDYFNKIDYIKKELNKINPQINNNNNHIHNILYSLRQLEDYEKEYKEYNTKYNTIELIKKYTSPTKEGIQTLFIQLYMGRTLTMANELLSLFFNGAMELLPYVINENEFRIPCHNTNSNIINDDINSCSSSEKSIISMLISFALLNQSSTKYNILRLDEVDGVLDQINRSSYLVALDLIMAKLNVETCFVISHSSEFDSNDVDVIYLGDRPEMISGNIIFTY